MHHTGLDIKGSEIALCEKTSSHLVVHKWYIPGRSQITCPGSSYDIAKRHRKAAAYVLSVVSRIKKME